MQNWGMIQALFEDPDGNVFVLVEREGYSLLRLFKRGNKNE
jgi:hypothetical protein